MHKSDRLTAKGNEARYGENRQTATAKKPKDVTGVSETGIVTDYLRKTFSIFVDS